MKYDDKAERWTEEAYADADAYLAHRAELILSLGPPLDTGDTVLDLACGSGRHTRYLAGRGLQVEAVDRDAALRAWSIHPDAHSY